MKLSDLKNAVAKAQQELELVKRKAVELQLRAKTTRARADHAWLVQERARKAAKQAKKLAVAAEDQACEQCSLLTKAQKRLAKAMKKVGRAEAASKKKSDQPAAAHSSAAKLTAYPSLTLI